MEQLAEMTDGFSGFDLHELCRRSAYRVVKDLLASVAVSNDSDVEDVDESQALSSTPNRLVKRAMKMEDFTKEVNAMQKDSQVARNYGMVDNQEDESDFPRVVNLEALEAFFQNLARYRQPNGSSS